MLLHKSQIGFSSLFNNNEFASLESPILHLHAYTTWSCLHSKWSLFISKVLSISVNYAIMW